MNESALRNALELRRAGRLAEAAEVYAQILRTDPRPFEALHSLGILHFQSGRFEDAERLIGQAVAVNPASADAHYHRGSLLQRLNRYEDALAS